MELIDIYRAFHAKAVEYTFFSSADGTFSRIDHMLGQKVSFHKFEKTEIISSIFYEIRNQLQGRKKHKKHKCVEAKQYATKQSMEH